MYSVNQELQLTVEKFKPQRNFVFETIFPKVPTAAAFHYFVRQNYDRLEPIPQYSDGSAPVLKTGERLLPKSDATVRTWVARILHSSLKSTLADPQFEKDKLVEDAKDELLLISEIENYTSFTSATACNSAASWSTPTSGWTKFDQMSYDIAKCKKTMLAAYGVEPNWFWAPPMVYNFALKEMAESGLIPLDASKEWIAKGVDAAIFKSILGLNMAKADVTYNNANTGATPSFTNVWANDYGWFAYVDPNPSTALGKVTAGFMAETKHTESGSPWFVRPVEETETGGHWMCEVSYWRKFILPAAITAVPVYQMKSSASGALVA